MDNFRELGMMNVSSNIYSISNSICRLNRSNNNSSIHNYSSRKYLGSKLKFKRKIYYKNIYRSFLILVVVVRGHSSAPIVARRPADVIVCSSWRPADMIVYGGRRTYSRRSQ